VHIRDGVILQKNREMLVLIKPVHK